MDASRLDLELPGLGLPPVAIAWLSAPSEPAPPAPLCPSMRDRATSARTMGDDAVALMERYCDGDASAFRALYALAAPRLLAYLTCLTHDRSTAEELLQQTFIKLHQARASYVRGADPMPWLYTIAHRTCLDEFRRARRSRVKVARDDKPLPEPPAALDGAPEERQ